MAKNDETGHVASAFGAALGALGAGAMRAAVNDAGVIDEIAEAMALADGADADGWSDLSAGAKRRYRRMAKAATERLAELTARGFALGVENIARQRRPLRGAAREDGA